MLILLIFCVLFMTMLIGFKNWKLLVFCVFILLLLEYPIRMTFPEAPYQILLIKEPVIFLIYLTLLFKISRNRAKVPILFFPFYFLFSFLVVGTSEALLNQNRDILQILVGLRSYLWYTPFIIVGFYFFKDQKELIQTVDKAIFVVPLIVGFQMFQFIFWDSDIPIVRPLGSPFHSFELENIKLIPGPFGTAARCARVLFICFMIILSLSNVSHVKPTKKVVFLVLSSIGIFLTGVRSTFFLIVFSFMLFLLLSKRVFRRLSTIWILVLVVFVVLAGVMSFAFSDYIPILKEYYIESVPLILIRTKYTMSATIDCIKKVGFVGGYGVGTASQGIQYLVKEPLHVRVGMIGYYENGIWKLTFETGIVGAILYFLFLLSVLNTLFNSTRIQPKNSFNRDFSLAVFIIYLSFFIHFSTVHHQLLGDSTTLIPLWFLVGVVFRMKN